MKYLRVIFAVLALVSCERSRSFDEKAALIWSQKPVVQLREQSATYSFLRSNGSWVAISTAKMTETEIGLLDSQEKPCLTHSQEHPSVTHEAALPTGEVGIVDYTLDYYADGEPYYWRKKNSAEQAASSNP